MKILMSLGVSSLVLLIGCANPTPAWVNQGKCKDYFDNPIRTSWMGCDFHQQDLVGVDFSTADFLAHSLFFRAKLGGANLSGVMLYYNDFQLADLSGANLSRVTFLGSHLAEAEFRDADLTDATFWRVDARGADFTGAVLVDAWFRSGTNLVSANFTGADLRDANFSNVFLKGTNFTDADLTGASGVLYQELSEGSPFFEPPVFCRTTMPDGVINNEGC